jgi:hypothetical protein
MLVVVPAEEVGMKSAGVLDAPEALREVRTVLERLELRLRVRVVIRGWGIGFGQVGPSGGGSSVSGAV